MKHYAVAELEITDPSWVQDYVTHVTPMVERHGGRYLARTPRVAQLEGDRPVAPLTLIIEWPSEEAARAFYESDEYRPFRERRAAGARNEFRLVAGEDVTGAAKVG
ncbi:MAG TPA: DUF1330 domain-containing protein [Baekduia sp.]|uniref:DUF1330 domain-containing protein n=1 Tax=Baekduia sp. TaxID=2600305 RepID=UPI002D76B67D|nr:DUF1330 domain-containing protein [Baekduia sp.]HET6510456.1 DUF1330 domain-containing protein [Baekduia sp.]